MPSSPHARLTDAKTGGEFRLGARGRHRRGQARRAVARDEVRGQLIDHRLVLRRFDLGDRDQGRPAETGGAEKTVAKGLAALGRERGRIGVGEGERP